MRAVIFALTFSLLLHGAGPNPWLDRTMPVMSTAEKKLYRSMNTAEQKSFEDSFWSTKRIGAVEYEQRAAFADTTYGSGRTGSGANTDRGRVHLSLGPPSRITRLASTRSFFPIEIWYYSHAPAAGVQSEIQLLFFQKNGIGEYRLYSPTLNTIRDLMNPQASTRGMFGVNDIVTESDVRTKLTLSPAEDEVISAAIGVARGVTGMGNDEILALVSSPAKALSRSTKEVVQSRLLFQRPGLTTFQTTSPEGVPQIDLLLETDLFQNLELEIQQAHSTQPITVSRQATSFHFAKPMPVRYEQRVDLLPGEYRLLFRVDGKLHPYNLSVTDPGQKLSDILLANAAVSRQAKTPFEFSGTNVEPDPNGSIAAVQLGQPGTVTWRLLRGLSTVWAKRAPSASGVVLEKMGDGSQPAGEYILEVSANGETRRKQMLLGQATEQRAIVSHNANLDPATRLAAVAHQWLLRGDFAKADYWLTKSETAHPTDTARIDRARLLALQGHFDEARRDLTDMLAANPDNFEALTTYGFVETQLQDFAVAEKFYRRALAVNASPEVEQALARMPRN